MSHKKFILTKKTEEALKKKRIIKEKIEGTHNSEVTTTKYLNVSALVVLILLRQRRYF